MNNRKDNGKVSIFRSFQRILKMASVAMVLCCSSAFFNVAYGALECYGGDSNNDTTGIPASGGVVSSTPVVGQNVTLPPNGGYTIPGYVISGWDCYGEDKDTGGRFSINVVASGNGTFSFVVPADYTSASNIYCTAQWTACTCTEGTGVSSGSCNKSVTNNQCVYSWLCNSGYSPSVTVPYTLTLGTSYTANCEPIDYGIFYLNMGSIDIPSGVTLPNTYNVESSTITIPALTPSQRPHETFVGWCEWDNVNNTYNPNTCSLNLTIPAGSVGHRYYYARWSCDTGYTTSFNVANNYGGSGLDILNNGTSANVSGDVWSVVFGNDDPEITLSGIGMCSDANAGYYPYQFVTMQELNAAYVDGYKEMCWCKLSGYSYDGESQNLSTDFWVYNGGTSHCTQASCQAKCLEYTKEDINDQRERLLFASNVCEPNRYHIIYNQGTQAATMPDPDIVYYGDTYTLASAPSATGYTFTGWSCPNLPHATVQQNGYYAAETIPDTNLNTNQPYGYDYLGDVTCTAQWERNTHTITFKTGNNVMGTQICNEGDTVTLDNVSGMSNIPVNTTQYSVYGWQFRGWQTVSHVNGTTLDYTNGANYVCSADITLYGLWKREVWFEYYSGFSSNQTFQTHYLDYQYYRNVDTSSAGATAITTPSSPPDFSSTDRGWRPIGWVRSGTMQPVFDFQQQNVEVGISELRSSFAAKYERTPLVVYDGNGNTAGATSATTCGTQFHRTGTTTVNSSCMLENNGFTRTGHVFTGWNTAADGTGTPYAEGSSYAPPGRAFESVLTSTLYAQWTPCSCTNGNHSTCGNTALVSNNTCSYDFTCDTHYNYNNASGGTVPASAAGVGPVQAPDCSPITHTITVVRDDGSGDIIVNNGGTAETVSGSTFTCNDGDTVTFPDWGSPDNLLTKTGNVFTGWDTSTFTCDADTTVTAQWAECSCTIQQGSHVASCSANNPSVVNNTCDYNFVCDTGYNYNGASGGTATASAGDPNVTAGSCSLTTHTITFKTGSTVMGTQTCNEGDTVTLNNVSGMSNIPVSDTYGWSFLGWATQSGTTARAYGNADTNYVCDADRTLYGVWERMLRFTSYFSANSTGTGTASPSQRYYNSTDSSAGVNAVTTPTIINNFSSSVQGWNSIGWGYNDNFVSVVGVQQSFAPGISDQPNFVAIYERSPQIAYDGNGNTGGSRSNTPCPGPQRHITNGATEEVLGCILGNNGFIKDDYNFDTWYTNADGTGGTSYAEGTSYTFPNNTWTSSNTATLYAQWQKNNYDITYDCNGGTVVGSNTTPVETSVTRTDAAQYYPSSTYSFETVGSVCEREYYTPQSWNCSYTDSNNTSHTVTAGDTVQPYNVTCLAVWDTGQIYLSWEPNNGETIETPNMCTWGGSMTDIQHPTKTGYSFLGWALEVCLLPSELVSTNGNAYGSKSPDGSQNYNIVPYDITESGQWGVSWANGDKVMGQGFCSSTTGESQGQVGTPDTNSTGQSCWCKLTNYTANGSNSCDLQSSSWIFAYTGPGCDTACASDCAYYVKSHSNFRTAIFGNNVASP